MSFIFGGGGGGGGGGSSSGTQQNIQREAPGVESRKLALYDQAAKLAAQPVSLPGIQVAPATGLEQAAFTQAGQTGVGAPTLQAGITAAASGVQAPNINQFFNPFDQFVSDEVTRQAGIAQNQLAAQAVRAGAFGGGREGVQRAEIERARQANIGQLRATGFQQALGAAQAERQRQLQGGQLLGALGAQQQQMGLADIQSQLQAGAVQRGLGQAALEASRQTQLQRQFEPFQRIEFLKGIMTNLPTTQSSITATTAPGSNPVSQALGAGLGAYSTYQFMQPRR
jgi:hypothetical protein